MSENLYKKNLISKIKKKKAIIGIVGVGYVGIRLLIEFSKKFKVIAFDRDQKKINLLKNKKSPFSYIKDQDIKKIKNITYTSNLKNVDICDVLILCLPTPLKNNKPDLSHINSVVKKIYSYIVPGQLIILESTSYPGTTKQTIVRKLKKFDIGKNYFVGYSPEREDPGSKKFIFKNIPKIISGYSKNCQQITNILYQSIVKKTVKSKNIEIAETAKVYENIYRAVNIALVNEMRFFLKKINININDVIDLAKTKPFGFSEFRPGPGVGGHCIPIDPLYLSWIAKKNNFNTRFIELASKVNIKTTQKIQKIIQDIIEKKKIKKVLIIGLAYKKNIEDKRESASIKIHEFLSKKNIKINFFDRLVKNVKINEKKKNSVKFLNLKKLKEYDLIIIATDHDNIDYSWIIKNSKLVIDLRNRYKKDYDNLIKI